jgi:Fur family iron response transcriptional regulator|tara:strand:- start:372 stop:785 length:414 start_codon:yes stop_codon:yes gene_type:complete
MVKNFYIENALQMLKESPLKLTDQRVCMINILFKNGASHFTAEDIYNEVNKKRLKISLATIYNCLNQFKEYGIIKAVKVSSDKIYFDTNLKEHHHFFCQESEKLTDIKTDHVKISKLPKLPKGKKLKSIEVIINITE